MYNKIFSNILYLSRVYELMIRGIIQIAAVKPLIKGYIQLTPTYLFWTQHQMPVAEAVGFVRCQQINHVL